MYLLFYHHLLSVWTRLLKVRIPPKIRPLWSTFHSWWTQIYFTHELSSQVLCVLLSCWYVNASLGSVKIPINKVFLTFISYFLLSGLLPCYMFCMSYHHVSDKFAIDHQTCIFILNKPTLSLIAEYNLLWTRGTIYIFCF